MGCEFITPNYLSMHPQISMDGPRPIGGSILATLELLRGHNMLTSTISGHGSINTPDFSAVLGVVVDEHVLRDAQHGQRVEVWGRPDGNLKKSLK